MLSSAALSTASELAFPLSPYLTKGIYKTMLSAYINVVSFWTVFGYCRTGTVPYFGPEYKLWLFTFLFFLTRQVIRVVFLPSQYSKPLPFVAPNTSAREGQRTEFGTRGNTVQSQSEIERKEGKPKVEQSSDANFQSLEGEEETCG